jgi:hypothetical protein
VRIQKSMNEILFRAITLLAITALKFAWAVTFVSFPPPNHDTQSPFWLRVLLL